jgi:hypothetical protein
VRFHCLLQHDKTLWGASNALNRDYASSEATDMYGKVTHPTIVDDQFCFWIQ